MNKNDPFRIFENADDDFTEKLSDTPKLNNIEKERMFEMSMNIYSEMKNNNSVGNYMKANDSVEGVEKYSRPKWYKPLMSAAACIVAVGGIAAMGVFLKNHNGNHRIVTTPDVVATQVTSTIVTDNAMAGVTAETTSVTTDVSVTTDYKKQAEEAASIASEKAALQTTTVSRETIQTTAQQTEPIETQPETTQPAPENNESAESQTTMSEEDRQLLERANEFYETACRAHMGFRSGTGLFDVGEQVYDENGNPAGKRLDGSFDANGEYLGYLIKDPDINTVDDALAKYYEIFSTRYPDDNIKDYFREYEGHVYWRSGGRGSNISYEYSKVTEIQRKEGDEIFFTAESSYCYDFELMNTGHGTIVKDTFSVVVQPDGSWRVGQFRMPY